MRIQLISGNVKIVPLQLVKKMVFRKGVCECAAKRTGMLRLVGPSVTGGFATGVSETHQLVCYVRVRTDLGWGNAFKMSNCIA